MLSRRGEVPFSSPSRFVLKEKEFEFVMIDWGLEHFFYDCTAVRAHVWERCLV